MPTIQLNGTPRQVPAECTVADLLEDLGINNRYCAVEQNQYVVPREEHHERFLQDGDSVEVVTLVGGG